MDIEWCLEVILMGFLLLTDLVATSDFDKNTLFPTMNAFANEITVFGTECWVEYRKIMCAVQLFDMLVSKLTYENDSN